MSVRPSFLFFENFYIYCNVLKEKNFFTFPSSFSLIYACTPICLPKQFDFFSLYFIFWPTTQKFIRTSPRSNKRVYPSSYVTSFLPHQLIMNGPCPSHPSTESFIHSFFSGWIHIHKSDSFESVNLARRTVNKTQILKT